MRLNNEWDKVLEFEETIAEFCGSKYAVAVDSNTNGIKLVLEYLKIKDTIITIPKKTYVSVPNQIIHSGNIPKFEDIEWSGEYRLDPTPIVDSACRFKKDMYINDTYQILSFHHRKIIKIGKGGMILTNDENFVSWCRPMIYDGRHIDKMYTEDEFECIGYHMYMTPEDAKLGMECFRKVSINENDDCGSSNTYKDLTQQSIFKNHISGQ
jgi:dTDP-4-amino-4,6-dideoxygalactose transaminase